MNFEESFYQLEEALQTALSSMNTDSETGIELYHKEQQLIHIEKSICQFQNKAVPIPEELRNLKLNLILEIDQLKQQETYKNKIILLLRSTLKNIKVEPDQTPLNKKKLKRKNQGRITLKEMIETKSISAYTEIFCVFKKITMYAKITDKGQIQIQSTKEYFDNPSSAAYAVSNYSLNGWIFWKVKEGNNVKDLDYYRKKHKELLKQRG